MRSDDEWQVDRASKTVDDKANRALTEVVDTGNVALDSCIECCLLLLLSNPIVETLRVDLLLKD